MSDTNGRSIAVSLVIGAAVFGPDEAELGRVEDLLIGKQSGLVECAVLAVGGFLGIGEEQVSVPWQSLTWVERLGGYVIPDLPARPDTAPGLAPA